MPLHDWSELSRWQGVHLFWIAELVRSLKASLPAGYHAYCASGRPVAVGAPAALHKVAIRSALALASRGQQGCTVPGEHGTPEVAVTAIDSAPALYVERDG